MKTLKITFLLLAVVLLTVSGQRSDTVVDNNEPTFNEVNKQNLLVIDKKRLKLETHG